MHRCIRYSAVMVMLGIGFSAWGQGPELPAVVSGDPVMGLLAWAVSNYGITGAIMLLGGYLLGKRGGIPVRLSDEDRELLEKVVDKK